MRVKPMIIELTLTNMFYKTGHCQLCKWFKNEKTP